jgi:hypothetical protein
MCNVPVPPDLAPGAYPVTIELRPRAGSLPAQEAPMVLEPVATRSGRAVAPDD